MLKGYVDPDFAEVARVLERQLRGTGGGAAVCVYHRGEPVVDLWGGARDSLGNPWRPDTLALSYSTSKGVASTLLHVLADRGLVDYDAPVADYWPEFAQSGKERIRVRHVLCHEAGLYAIRSMVDHARRILDWAYMVEALSDSVPVHEPGAAHGYHGLTYGWLVGELVQRVTGRSFAEALASELAGPLDLDGLFIGLPPEQRQRRAQLVGPAVGRRRISQERVRPFARSFNRVLRLAGAPIDLSELAAALVPRGMDEIDFNSDEFVSVPVPAANGTFTARSLAKLYAVLAGGGALHGVRLLGPETLRRASEVQNRGVGRVIPFPMHWRLGYHRVPLLGVRAPRAFGHFGFGGSGAFADPDRELAVAMVLNSGLGTPFADLRLLRVGSAAARSADRR